MLTIPVDQPLFHLQVSHRKENSKLKVWTSLIFADLSPLITFLSQHDLIDIQIGFQPRKLGCKNYEYRIISLLEILEMKDETGYSSFLLKGVDRTYIDGNGANLIGKVIEQRLVWRQKSCAENNHAKPKPKPKPKPKGKRSLGNSCLAPSL